MIKNLFLLIFFIIIIGDSISDGYDYVTSMFDNTKEYKTAIEKINNSKNYKELADVMIYLNENEDEISENRLYEIKSEYKIKNEEIRRSLLSPKERLKEDSTKKAISNAHSNGRSYIDSLMSNKYVKYKIPFFDIPEVVCYENTYDTCYTRQAYGIVNGYKEQYEFKIYMDIEGNYIRHTVKRI